MSQPVPPPRELTIVYSAHDVDATYDTGKAGNQPEARKRLVLARLRANPRVRHALTVDRPVASLPRSSAALVHDVGLLDFLEIAWDEWVREYEAAGSERTKHDGVFGDVESTSERPPPLVAGFSAPRHDGIQQPTKHVFGKVCYYSCDKETPITSSTASTLKWDVAVVDRAYAELTRRKNGVVYAQITHPGHHAGFSYYGGFCFVNQACVACKLLRTQHSKVALIDVDYHSGNGSMNVFWNDPAVLVASLHADPEREYPFNEGFANQIGGEKAKGTKINVPLPGGTSWKTYKPHLQAVIDRVKEFGATALVVSLGFDTLKGDPVALPGMGFQFLPSDAIEMGNMLLRGERDATGKSLSLPTIVVQEGGYGLTDVPPAVEGFLTGHITLEARI